jgi:hypothetical protein
MWRFLPLLVALLTGCVVPVSTITFRPFSGATGSEVVSRNDPAITNGLAIIDAVLRENGFTPVQLVPNSFSGPAGWQELADYERNHEDVHVDNQGKVGSKASVRVTVVFNNWSRLYLRTSRGARSVRDQIAAELARRFGAETVVVEEHREVLETN